MCYLPAFAYTTALSPSQQSSLLHITLVTILKASVLQLVIVYFGSHMINCTSADIMKCIDLLHLFSTRVMFIETTVFLHCSCHFLSKPTCWFP